MTTPQRVDLIGPGAFSLDPDGVRAWLTEKVNELDAHAPSAEEVTFGDLGDENLHECPDRWVCELVHAGVLREPPGWSVGVYPLGDTAQWAYLATVRVSSDAVYPGGARFFQVAEESEEVGVGDLVVEHLDALVAAANRLLPLARAAQVGTDPAAAHHPDGMCKAHGDYDCGEDECR